MRIEYFGHSTFLIHLGGKKILIDPFMRDNPLCGVEPSDVDVDIMLITHGHGDHIADAVEIARNTNCLVVSNYEIVEWLAAQGVEHGHHLNHGGSFEIGNLRFKYVNAVHSSVLPDGTYGGNPGGFILSDGEKEYYFAGDSSLCIDMELIGRHHQIDLAFLPIGDTFTMGHADAAIAAEMVKTKKVIGMHFDTFPPIVIDREAANTSFQKKGVELILMEANSHIEV